MISGSKDDKEIGEGGLEGLDEGGLGDLSGGLGGLLLAGAGAGLELAIVLRLVCLVLAGILNIYPAFWTTSQIHVIFPY